MTSADHPPIITGRNTVRLTDHANLVYDVPDGMRLCPSCAGTGCQDCQSSGIVRQFSDHISGTLTPRELAVIADCRSAVKAQGHADRVAWLQDRRGIYLTGYEVNEAAFTGHIRADMYELLTI